MVFIIFASIIGIALSAATYFLSAYTLMCMGRKAGLKSDWMPYVPIANTIYRLLIVRQPVWKMLFVGGTGVGIGAILSVVFWLIFGSPTLPFTTLFELSSIIPCLYAVAIIIFSFELEYKTFKAFGFNPYFAFATFVVPVASMVMYYIIAFSNLYEYVGLQGTKASIYNERDNNKRRPLESDFIDKTAAYQEDPPTAGIPSSTSYVLCTAGAYKGGSFPIRDGEELVIGRDSTISQIVVTSASKVSRRHCGIRYSALDNRYIVTDYSTNGTFLADGTKLVPMTPTPVGRNTVLIIGDQENQFKLS